MALTLIYPYTQAVPPREIVSLQGEWRIFLGDQTVYSDPSYQDDSWDTIKLPGNIIEFAMEKQKAVHGICWLRKTIVLPKERASGKLGLILGRIGNADETYVNGVKIGGMGEFPPKEFSMWNHPRNYPVPENILNFGGENLIAVKVSYFAIGEILGRMMLTGYKEWKRYSVASEFVHVTMGYVAISMGMALLMIFSFFFLKRHDSEEYLFYCLQLVFGFPIVLELCNHWHIYPSTEIRYKVLAISWVALNVAHPIFLHRIYNLERKRIEYSLWFYLAMVVFIAIFLTPVSWIRVNGTLLILVTTGIGFYNFSCHISALVNKSPYAKQFAFFGITVVLCAIHDGFVYLMKFSGIHISVLGYTPTAMIFHVGAILLYMGTSLVLVSRLINMTEEVDVLNTHLENFIIENALLNDKIKTSLEKKTTATISTEAEEKIKSVMSYINKNYLSDITREGLASSVGVHPDSLGKQFKKYTGQKLGDYIYELRINEAARRLREEDTTIIDIAFGVGFESVRTFNRIFPKFMNCTPNKYRQVHRKSDPPEER